MNKLTPILLVLTISSILFISSCGGITVESTTSTLANTETSYHVVANISVQKMGDVVRFVDDEYGTVCYVYSQYKQGGISCIPLSQVEHE